ncbi:MAG TPA: NUDIX domain-containing protein, partial [Kineosporiaceae bacterium]|nr:NUDIX domain-containing protein [Kineosporiaceae bacterium]
MTGDPSPAPDDPPVPEMVRAAGVICWRPARERRRDRGSTGTDGTHRPDPDLEVLLVHRPRYDDWSWPKGKLEPGESLPECAVRETAEETGARVVLG